MDDYDVLYSHLCEFKEMLALAEDRYIERSMRPFREGHYVERIKDIEAVPLVEVFEVEPEQARNGYLYRRKRKSNQHLTEQEGEYLAGHTGHRDRVSQTD